jgi:hypothetical protein
MLLGSCNRLGVWLLASSLLRERARARPLPHRNPNSTSCLSPYLAVLAQRYVHDHARQQVQARLDRVEGDVLLLVACRFGSARLIDNLAFRAGAAEEA